MHQEFEFEGYMVKQVELEKEVNFELSDEKGYICRLVPGFFGFELSTLDRAVDNQIDPNFLARLSDYIVRKDDLNYYFEKN